MYDTPMQFTLRIYYEHELGEIYQNIEPKPNRDMNSGVRTARTAYRVRNPKPD